MGVGIVLVVGASMLEGLAVNFWYGMRWEVGRERERALVGRWVFGRFDRKLKLDR